ncbi:MAG: ATP-dependent zinc metalloprotease FtsH [Chloroflexi bacterium]|nr:ATP-dependent zinc metalloprotease FtsH [Chloroflexota bacterium]
MFYLAERPAQTASQQATVELSQVASEVTAGQVQKITVQGDTLNVKKTDGSRQAARKESSVSAPQALRDLGVAPEALSKVAFEVNGPSGLDAWGGLIGSLLPIALLLGFLWYMGRSGQRQAMGQMFSFSKSRAKPVVEDKPSVTFADVAGVDEARLEMEEIVGFLRGPGQFEQLGARIPKGVLLVGPPGTGKTLLARAVAGQAGVAFFHLSGSEFVEMFVGVGAARVRDLFDQAKRAAPCIVFVDEIDAIGRHRGAGLGGGNDEREQTLNQILVEMDGFEPNAGVVVLAATNRADVLDPALLRPGRFDRQVTVDLPDLRGRHAILDVHARGKPLSRDVDLGTIARQTPGFSGADLANLLNEAALLAARRKVRQIAMADIESASERVTMGPERRGRVVSQQEKAVTAYHEAGHSLVARMVPHADPVHKITIVGRGRAGGYTQLLPSEERHLWSKSQFQDALVWILAGQASEELVFGEATTGASNDLERATGIARDMVTRYGMSDALGPLALGRHEGLVFLGRDMAERQEYSEETARLIDQEVRRLVDDAKARALHILTEVRPALERIAGALVERETLDGAEFEALVLGEDLEERKGNLPRLAQPPASPVPAIAALTE